MSTGPSVGLGVFDGFHLGHQVLIEECTEVMTFQPHPARVLGKKRKLKQLTTVRELRFYIKKLTVVPFNLELAKLSPIKFLDDIIYSKVNPKKIVVGYDFRFGHNREGTIKLLRDWAEGHQIQVVEVAELSRKDTAIKSSMIRKEMENGSFDNAVAMLGHSYLIMGRVIHGEGRGRKLGFPTANIQVPKHKLIPLPGVYRGATEIEGKGRRCLIYIGSKPTFSNGKRQIEVHIPGFSGDLYNKILKVFLEGKLRDEKKFDNEEALVRQIHRDLAASSPS